MLIGYTPRIPTVFAWLITPIALYLPWTLPSLHLDREYVLALVALLFIYLISKPHAMCFSLATVVFQTIPAVPQEFILAVFIRSAYSHLFKFNFDA